ncbi:MAG TPA: arginine--tRNA ligase [Pseudomonadota bacterium]|nr:arginine--tRNA ligase [Pseudomonadota bacterium]
MKELLSGLVRASLDQLRADGRIALDTLPEIVFERTRAKEFGDFACNIAMQLAKPLGRKPRDIAEWIVAALPAHPSLAKVDIAGPGFLNFFVTSATLQQVVTRVLDDERYGFAPKHSRESVQVEFVSANPNGPLHVGHGRGAAYGSTLANLLEAGGYQVSREYYVNDAGRQMDILAISVWLRYLELGGETIRFPDNGYKGDYVRGIARDLRLAAGSELHQPIATVFADIPADEGQGGDKEQHVDALIVRARALLGDANYRRLFEAGLKACLDDIKQDLGEFRVLYDQWFSERSLTTSGAVQRAIDVLTEKGHMYEKDGALWFRATDFGDEKDRVVRRDNGATTYFASDIAYLLNKFDRGYDRAVYVFGADHHGYVARLKAAAQGLGVDPDRLEIKLVQFAILFEGGEKVQMSTRAGQFVTLRDLRREVGVDAARFFYVMRSHDQHLDFDLDLARSQSVDNPVYYLQYTHARLCGLFRQAVEKSLPYDEATARASLDQLSEAQAQAVLEQLDRFPEDLRGAVEIRSPHLVVAALRELAARYNAFYNGHHFLVDDAAQRCARLALAACVRRVLANGLGILGVSAPETM